jgi:hypothetical protein
MEARTVVPVAVVPVQIAEAVTATIVSRTRSQTATVVKNLTVQLLDAGTAEVKEAAGKEMQLEKQKKTKRLRGTEIRIVFGTGMAIKRRRENVTKTKTAGKGTASEIVNESGIAIATGIGIDTAEMIKTATGIPEKSETSSAAITLPSRQVLIVVVCLFVPILRGIETYQMATRPLGKEEDLLTMR